MNAERPGKVGSRLDRRAFITQGIVAAGVLLRGGKVIEGSAAYPQKSTVDPIVETTTGKVRGMSQGGVSVFKGIPYGASTEGSGRFMPATKVKPWTGVRDALQYGPKSPQSGGGAIPEVEAMMGDEKMSEDCLSINVWTAGPTGQKRPVIFWLHGGGFASGSGAARYYDGTALAGKQDVVVVTVNHRLNLFGFLNLAGLGGEKYSRSSNLGMLDIVAALQWVRDNIAAFGGDPNRVTIMGQSGGGGKVSTLMAMPSAKGLFHRAVAMSGTALNGVPQADATKSTQAFMATLGLKPNQVDELQKLSMQQLLDAMRMTRGLRLSPVVDGRTLPTDPFDPVAPSVSADVPMILSSVATEVTFQTNTPLDPIDEKALHMHVKGSVGISDADADRLIAVYRKAQPQLSNLDLYHVLASDAAQRMNMTIQAERKAALNKAPAYVYYFKVTTPVRGGKLKSPHTIDIAYAFDNVARAAELTGGQDPAGVAAQLSGAVAAFARNGNPGHKGIPNWEAYNSRQRQTMVFDKETKLVSDPNREERLALTAIRASRS